MHARAIAGGSELWGSDHKKSETRHWRTLWGPAYSYSLAELAKYLPGIENHVPRKRPELCGVGRNVDTFDHLRHYAYTEIRLWYAPPRRQGVYVAWQNHLYQRALNFTSDEHPSPLDRREAHYIAKSVARWVWQRFSPERCEELKSRRGRSSGRKSGLARRKRAADRDREIVRLHESGVAKREIARLVDVSEGTVRYVLGRGGA